MFTDDIRRRLVAINPLPTTKRPRSPLRETERRSGTLARRISPIRRIVVSLNRKRNALPALGGATPEGEDRSPVLDTATALPAGYASTH